ncbi:MAG: DASS family sodium-coupled anion symporter [Armatimonadetes bacterium]|nr:DASS family sodium-coupled anion symporter [Armatimonadota bacterium]
MEDQGGSMTRLKLAVSLAASAASWWLLRGLPGNQAPVAAVFVLTVTLWVSEALPLTATALLSTALLVFVGGIDEKKAFAAYGDTIVPLFVGSFILAKAMEITGLSNRFSWLILTQKWATRSPSSLLLAMGFIGCAISLFVSNTATTAMLLPIGVSMLSALGAGTDEIPFATAMMLMLTWGSSVAVGLPVGTPPNLIGIGMIQETAGVTITFMQWVAFAMPITLAMILAAWVVLWVLYRRNAPSIAHARPLALERYRELGRMGPAERNVLITFLIVLALWMIPDLSSAATELAQGKAAPWTKWLQGHLTPAVAALLGVALLFILPARDTGHGRTITWKQAASIDWGVIMLFGGGIALGQAMFSSGLAKTFGQTAADLTGAHSLWAITALCIAAAIILSELGSNTAAATTLVPVAIAIANGAGVSPIPPALGVALGASFGFILPVSTAPNAIVYSSGLVPAKQMMRSGALIDVVGFVVTLGCLYLILPAMGLAK